MINQDNKMKKDCETLGLEWNDEEDTCKIALNLYDKKTDMLQRLSKSIIDTIAPVNEIGIQIAEGNILRIKEDYEDSKRYLATCSKCQTYFPIKKSAIDYLEKIKELKYKKRNYSKIKEIIVKSASPIAYLTCPHCGMTYHVIKTIINLEPLK